VDVFLQLHVWIVKARIHMGVGAVGSSAVADWRLDVDFWVVVRLIWRYSWSCYGITGYSSGDVVAYQCMSLVRLGMQ